MRRFVFALLCLASLSAAWAQPPKPASDDSWTNHLPAPDDRYSNPKSPLYNGPNGWFSAGRVLAVVGPTGSLRYDYKASLNSASDGFAATESAQLHLMYMAFGTPKPADGVWEVAAKPDAAKKKVQVSDEESVWKQSLYQCAYSGRTLRQAKGIFYARLKKWPTSSMRLNPWSADEQDDGRYVRDVFPWLIRKKKTA